MYQRGRGAVYAIAGTGLRRASLNDWSFPSIEESTQGLSSFRLMVTKMLRVMQLPWSMQYRCIQNSKQVPHRMAVRRNERREKWQTIFVLKIGAPSSRTVVRLGQ